MEYGRHTVSITAQDAARNISAFQFEFELVQRDPFVIRLQPGWNAISLPSVPTEPDISSDFTDPAIQTIIGYHGLNRHGGWSIMQRRDGAWQPTEGSGKIPGIVAGYGFWVYSLYQIQQPVHLLMPVRRSTWVLEPDVHTTSGWNFVGVIDQDSDQIQDHFGTTMACCYELQRPVNARDYLGRYEVAYSWNAHTQSFKRLQPDDPVKIGEAIWVYYPEPGEP